MKKNCTIKIRYYKTVIIILNNPVLEDNKYNKLYIT